MNSFFFLRFDKLFKVGLSQITSPSIIQPLTLIHMNHQIKKSFKTILGDKDCYTLNNSFFVCFQIYLVTSNLPLSIYQKHIRHNIQFIGKT
jgi:hypothetical protein